MLNEVLYVKKILKSGLIDKTQNYGATGLIAKYYLSKGLSREDTVKKIFEWGKNHSIFFKHGLTRMVGGVFNDTKDIVKKIKVYISDGDIKNINNRFKTYNLKLIAFSFLVCSKVLSDNEGHFKISMTLFSSWVGIRKNHIYERYLQKMFSQGYIEKIIQGDDNIFLHKQEYNGNKILSSHSIYKITPLCDSDKNYKKYVYKDIDLREEFERIFNIEK